MTNDIESGNSSTLIIEFSPMLMEVVRKPSTNVVSALAKIGGLMALFNVSIVLTIWHQSRFTKKMNAKLGSSEW
jgi:hypothetical protein